ncbi:LIC12162 family transferase [Rhodoferax saidenbachensis]|nr:LIC12162 family protein [Rhodoferax saidenbachensis]
MAATKRRLLVTTSDQRSWRRDQPLLFIGNWCRLPDERERWEGLDAEVIPYHWDDRDKFRADYAYLQACYEAALANLATALNAHHGTQHGLRYWRILLGPWLYLFTHVLFDRWTMVAKAAERDDVDSTLLINDPGDELIPRDLRGMSPDDLGWNHFLYACAIREQGCLTWEEVAGESRGLMQTSATADAPVGAGETLRKAIRAFLDRLVLPGEAFFLNTGLPRSFSARLQLKLGQIPKFWRSPPPPQVAPDMALRGVFELPAENVTDDPFRVFLRKMIPLQIPTVYLEGYPALMEVLRCLPWPKRPRVIFTSNSFQFDEVFQAWAAARTQEGVPLVIGQHGGFYGVGEVVAGEDHQVEISDRFLTWGWRDARPSIYPLFALTNLDRKQGVGKPDGDLLLVTVPIRMVSFKNSSWPVAANQSQAFLSDQLAFAEALDAPARKQLVLRIHQRTDEKLRSAYVPQWRATFPKVEVDPSVTPIEQRLQSSRLFVYTYNSTGFLETLARNIPTVMFWNPGQWELRAEARPLFKVLADAGIFFEDPVAAARHVNAVWHDVVSWWLQPQIQHAVQAFCAQYARSVADPERELLAALTFESRLAAGK